MKRLFVVMLVIIVAGFAFGAGEHETPKEITVLHSPLGAFDYIEYATEKLQEDFPDVEVITMQADMSDGSTLTMDAQLAAGTPPNVYVDFIGRTSKYLVPEYALPLDEYIRDLDAYLPSALESYRTDGKLLGLPQPGGAQGMAVNMDIMREIGFEPSFDWKLEDFIEMAELVKAKYGGEKWATGMFAANQSGDYIINNWFPVFGAEWFADGYGYTTIAKTGGAKTYEFFQMLMENGYIPRDSASMNDSESYMQFGSGDIAAMGFFPGWVEVYQTSAISQGTLDTPFDVHFYPFPNGASTYISNSAIVVHETGTEQDVWAARFAEYVNDAYSQSEQSRAHVIPNRDDAEMLSDSEYVQQTADIVVQNGLMDVGLTQPFFARIRPQHFPVLQKVLNLEVTPEEAIAEYARRIDEAMNQ